MQYAELHCKTNFTFLDGASHADELVETAARMGYAALAVTDRHSLAGIVRAFAATKDAPIDLIVGAELHPVDAPPMVVWAPNRAAYAQLCRLLTLGRRRCEKGACRLYWADVAAGSDLLLCGLLLKQPAMETATSPVDHDIPTLAAELPSLRFDAQEDNGWLQWLGTFRELFGDRGYLLCELHRGVDDEAKLQRLQHLSQRAQVPLVAAGDVHYHEAARTLLHDCLIAIRHGQTIEQIRHERLENSTYHLRSLDELARQYRSAPAAIARTLEVASRCEFKLDQLRYEYPIELAPDGVRPIDHLKRLTWEGAKARYSGQVPTKVVDLLRHEMALIEELHYEAYFLTVWDLVRYARQRGILCQGRGSAANSVVCYCLGVTSVDPNELDLLFERFVSRERNEAPDIDVDFEHARREEVLQYIYQKYGRHRAGMTGAVITYRSRSAIRDVGKALGLSLDQIDGLAKSVDSRSAEGSLEQRALSVGLDLDSPLGKRFKYLVDSILGFPRHLSQHVGGMVITQGPLCELCPIENAAMEDRTVIQWDKDDLDELGILKVDCLSLGMLTAIHRSFDLLEKHYDRPMTLASVPREDSQVYDMICRADTVGVFQIESRAQMSMLPRLRPRTYYDLVIEVAIVRPGPIQGQMVHPYLLARRTGEQPSYPNEAIRQVLAKTMGVPIFQEQAMRLAVVAAGFTPGEADQLRRAMAAWRRAGVIDRFRQKLIEGMRANGLTDEFADRVFTQIRGFGEYGFPESHAASFALLVYVSCWLKHYYPDAFCAALLNSQPMGFYAPAQLVQDARQHGVEVLPADVNLSDWETTLERSGIRASGTLGSRCAVRLGLHMIRGLAEQVGQQIFQERLREGPFTDVADFTRRTRLGQATVASLADAAALTSISGDRRAALWQALAQDHQGTALPLLESSGVDVDDALPASLVPMQPIEEVYADYQTIGLSLRAHPVSFVRAQLSRMRVTTAAELKLQRDQKFVRVAGLVLLRQRPGTAKGITFVTLEDETGSINLVLRPDVWDRHYTLARTSNAWLVTGVLENREGVIHVVVGTLADLSKQVEGLTLRSRDFH
ncbi:MAG: error-prone DNA polymerase [Pirellulaceae bacterium]|nr:error-prone DNA polymerase [Pirellulaceae bacterium]